MWSRSATPSRPSSRPPITSRSRRTRRWWLRRYPGAESPGVSSSSSDALFRLGSALAASGALHLGAGMALEALPWDADGVPEHRSIREAPPLRVDFRVAQAAAPAPGQSRESKPAAQPTERYYLARELDVRPAPREPIEPVYPNDAYLKDIPGRVV